MALRAKRPCRHPGCPALVDNGYCDKHKAKQWNRHRANFRDRGYDSRWDKVRGLKVKLNPLCEECSKINHVAHVEIVHHIIPVDLLRQVNRDDLIYDMDNLKSDCRQCHGKEDDNIWYLFARTDRMQGSTKEIIERFERWKEKNGSKYYSN